MGVRLQWMVLLLLASSAFAAQPTKKALPRYDVVPTPEWVRMSTIPSPSSQAAKPETATEYLLVDRQIRVDQASHNYVRLVVRLVNPSGVEDQSQLAINFDPVRERLHLHSVKLLRNGRELDELRLGRIEVLQREQSLEQSVLDGSLTFHLVMSDVRVGDTLDYSYTVERRDPEWGNRLFTRLVESWDTPVRRSHLKIITKAEAPLHLLDHGDKKPVRQSDGIWESLEWDWSDIPGVVADGDAPSWFEQHATLQASQFENWSEIVNLTEPLYRIEDKPIPEFAALVTRFRGAGNTDEERALAVLRFVQEEVRYTGVELGAGAYRPAAPSQVLRRRYGDCKDKTLLTVALLRKLGLDATPALVGTRWKGHIGEQLPSPSVFDHAIVRLRIGSTTYWLDATATSEGGVLSRYARGPYGAALVVAPGVKELQPIPAEDSTDDGEVVDTEFDLRQGLEHESQFSVSTTYRGLSADDMRQQLHSTDREALARRYLNYYKRQYQGIRPGAPMQVKDDPQANELRVIEDYRLDHPFEETESGKHVFELQAEAISALLRAPHTSVRTSPLALAVPVNVEQHIKIRLPEFFPVKDDSQKIDAAGFRYESSVSHEGNDVLLTYHYWTVADSVAVADMSDYLKKQAEALDDTAFRFSKRVHSGPSAEQIAKALEQVKAAAALAKQQGPDNDKVDSILRDVIASEGFGGFTEAQQRACLYFAGVVALELNDAARALDLLRRSSEMEGATADDWEMRLHAANAVGDKSDAAFSLTTFATRWPTTLQSLDDAQVTKAVNQTPRAGTRRYKLLKALFDAKFSRPDADFSPWWRDLALLQLERGEPSEAVKTLSQVKEPYTIVTVLADNRFAPVRADLRDRLDVAAAAQRQIEIARKAVRQSPDKLQPVVHLMYCLLYSLRFEDVLHLADEVIARVDGSKGKQIYTDYDRDYVWILDLRSQALLHLGRLDEALAQELAASHREEYGRDNVSQVINLAELYNDLARPDEARSALSGLQPQDASAYGRMQMETERLNSADQLSDTAEARIALEFLQAHQNDSISTYQRALVRGNREEEAARLLISRLGDPDQRILALVDIQQFAVQGLTERTRELQHRWEVIVHRPDVQEAIMKVGNVGSYRLLPAAH